MSFVSFLLPVDFEMLILVPQQAFSCNRKAFVALVTPSSHLPAFCPIYFAIRWALHYTQVLLNTLFKQSVTRLEYNFDNRYMFGFLGNLLGPSCRLIFIDVGSLGAYLCSRRKIL